MNYPLVNIGDYVSLRQGFAINAKSKHYVSDKETKFPLLRIADMKNGTKEIFLIEEIPNRFVASPKDIIYTRTGQIGLVFTNQMGVVHNNCFTVTSNDETILCPKYLYYVLQTKKFYTIANSRAKGAAQPDLTHGAFKTIPIPLPHIAIQHRIDKILSAYDDMIDNCKKQIALLEEAAGRLYREWFVDLRFPGHETTPVGEDGLPQGWSILNLSDIADITMGQSPASKFYNTDAEGLPFHQGVSSYGEHYVVDTTYTAKWNKVAISNSILFSVRAPVGRINLTDKNIAIGRGLAAIYDKTGNQEFLYFSLKNKFFRDDVMGNGTIFSSISKSELEMVRMIMPTQDLLINFNSLSKNYLSQIHALGLMIKKLDSIKEQLLPRLISGQIEIE